MKPLISVTAACLSCLLGTVAAQETGNTEAQAQQDLPASPHQEQATREIKSDLFERLDRDRDGSISRQEAQGRSLALGGLEPVRPEPRLDAGPGGAFRFRAGLEGRG